MMQLVDEPWKYGWKTENPLLEWVNMANKSCTNLLQCSTALAIWMCKSLIKISLNHIECGYKVILTGGNINNHICSDHSAWQLSPSELCTKCGQLTQQSQWLKVLTEIMFVYNLSNVWLKAEGQHKMRKFYLNNMIFVLFSSISNSALNSNRNNK